MSRRDRYVHVDVTPTVTASSAYSADDQVGGIQTLADAVPQDTQDGALLSVTVVDQAAQGPGLVIYFFDELPTVASSDHGELNVADGELQDKCIGQMTIAEEDYDALSAGTVATVPASSLGIVLRSAESGGNVYAVVKTTSTPTFAAADDLTLKYSIIIG